MDYRHIDKIVLDFSNDKTAVSIAFGSDECCTYKTSEDKAICYRLNEYGTDKMKKVLSVFKDTISVTLNISLTHVKKNFEIEIPCINHLVIHNLLRIPFYFIYYDISHQIFRNNNKHALKYSDTTVWLTTHFVETAVIICITVDNKFMCFKAKDKDILDVIICFLKCLLTSENNKIILEYHFSGIQQKFGVVSWDKLKHLLSIQIPVLPPRTVYGYN